MENDKKWDYIARSTIEHASNNVQIALEKASQRARLKNQPRYLGAFPFFCPVDWCALTIEDGKRRNFVKEELCILAFLLNLPGDFQKLAYEKYPDLCNRIADALDHIEIDPQK